MQKKLTEIGSHARQGDVMLRRIKDIPKNVVVTAPTLAYGEATGHHHTFGGGVVCFAEVENSLAEYAIVEEEVAPLQHQEHHTIEFPKGNYEKLIQVEDTGNEVVKVLD